MGRRGPQPEPVAAKIARGETRPSRVNYGQPLPLQRPPRMPDGMEREAQLVWRHVIREMEPAGVILGADRDILRAYCEAVASYTRNRRLLLQSGSVVKGVRGVGEVVVSPFHRVVREEREAMKLLARELGLSPAARAGLRMDMGATGGDLDAVLGPTPRLRVLAAAAEE